MPYLKRLGMELRGARERKCLDLETVAARTSFNSDTLESIEAGRLAPPLPILLPLAELYDLEYPHLLALAGHIEERQPQQDGTSEAC